MVGETSELAWEVHNVGAESDGTMGGAATPFHLRQCSASAAGEQHHSPAHLSFPGPGFRQHPVTLTVRSQPRSVQAPLPPAAQQGKAGLPTVPLAVPGSFPPPSLSCRQTVSLSQACGDSSSERY